MRGGLRLGLVALACVAGAPIGGCVADSSNPKARSAIDRADDAFGRVEAQAEQALPLLPPHTADRVRAGLALARLALALAGGSTDPAERVEYLRRAAGAIADVAAAAVPARVFTPTQ